MERVRRNERVAALTKILTSAPNQIFTLSQFCEMFAAAKSTLSEDMDLLRQVLKTYELGKLDTITGAAGGVRYRPAMSHEAALAYVRELCAELCAPSRLLPGGFLYLSDLLSDPRKVRQMAVIIAGRFYDANPDFVLTMETKGIPVALMTADALGVPLVIARHASRVYEGSAVNINYVTGSSGTIETMSLNRRAIKEGQRALIVDDFLKAGGTVKGMTDLMQEFNVEVTGTAVIMATASPQAKCVQDVVPLMVMDVNVANPDSFTVQPAPWLEA